MSFTLVSAILRGFWLIDKNYAESHLPLVASILKGQPVQNLQLPQARYVIEAQAQDAEGLATGKVGVVPVKDVLMKEDTWCSYGTKTLGQWLQEFDNDPEFIGTVLDMDSPGGSVDGTQEFHDIIKSAKKPVVTSVSGMMCSAAMWIGSPSSEILVSSDTAIIGSIGTMISFADYRGWKEFEGIKFHEIYADASTQKNKEFRDALNGDYSTMKSQLLNPLNDIFKSNIVANRPNLDQAETLNGQAVLTQRAIELGLADRRGDMKAAIKRVQELSQENMFTNRFKNLNSARGKKPTGEQLEAINKELAEAGISGVRLQEISNVLLATEGEERDIYVFAEDGEDLEGRRCVWADENGEPTEENVPAGSYMLADGRTLEVEERDGQSFVTSIMEGGGEEEQDPETADDDEQDVSQVLKDIVKDVKGIKDEIAAIKKRTGSNHVPSNGQKTFTNQKDVAKPQGEVKPSPMKKRMKEIAQKHGQLKSN